MSLSNIFTNNLPKLDLHGETSDIARVLVMDFINDNYKTKNEYFIIIHGIGSGILKKTVHKVLMADKRVLEYQIEFNNNGSKIVRLKI